MVKDQSNKMAKKGSNKRSAEDTDTTGGELKKSSLDVAELRNRLMAENAFVSGALSMVHVQKHRLQLSDDDGESDEGDNDIGNTLSGWWSIRQKGI